MNNYDYYTYSGNNPEEIFDPFYKKGVVVIPKDSSQTNTLTINHQKLINNITTFKTLIDKNYTSANKVIIDVVDDIIHILTTTNNINYSPFAQFFMVYNSTYSHFMNLKNRNERFAFVYEMLLKYCEERHDMYLSHGYSDVVLQVMCDNYSHKRNSKTSISKILEILKPYNLVRISDISSVDMDNSYFLPDKGDKVLFEQFLKKFNLKMESRKIEQNKYPDIVFKCNGHFYICELKAMKGVGGGQNKQIVEIAYFIQFSEDDDKFHYVSFLDSEYANTLFYSNSPKIVAQRNDIVSALKNNPSNYFVNTAGFQKLVEDIF